MKTSQLDYMIEEAIANLDDQYVYYGLRFEDKDKRVGDRCEKSRHNPDRDDERDFPVYGSRAYKRLPKLGGTCAWHIDRYNQYYKYSYWSKDYRRMNIDQIAPCNHCYIIASDSTATHDDCDYNEIVLINAIIVAKLY